MPLLFFNPYAYAAAASSGGGGAVINFKSAGAFTVNNAAGSYPTVTLTYPSSLVVGDLVIAYIAFSISSSPDNTIYSTAPAGWRMLDYANSTLSMGAGMAFWKYVGASEPTTATFNAYNSTGSVVPMGGQIFGFSGGDAPVPSNGDVAFFSSGNTFTFASVTPPDNSSWWMASAFDLSGSNIPTIPAGFTLIGSGNNTTTPSGGSSSYKALTSNSPTGTTTASTTDNLSSGGGYAMSHVLTTNPPYALVGKYAVNSVAANGTNTAISGTAFPVGSGDLIVVGTLYYSDGSVPSVSDTSGNVYTVFSHTDTTNGMSSALAYCLSGAASSSNVVTWTWPSATAPSQIQGNAGASYKKASGAWSFITAVGMTAPYQNSAKLTIAPTSPGIIVGFSSERYANAANVFTSPVNPQTQALGTSTTTTMNHCDFFNPKATTYTINLYDMYVGQGYGGVPGTILGAFA